MSPNSYSPVVHSHTGAQQRLPRQGQGLLCLAADCGITRQAGVLHRHHEDAAAGADGGVRPQQEPQAHAAQVRDKLLTPTPAFLLAANPLDNRNKLGSASRHYWLFHCAAMCSAELCACCCRWSVRHHSEQTGAQWASVLCRLFHPLFHPYFPGSPSLTGSVLSNSPSFFFFMCLSFFLS